jgi:hypothetical protein
LLKLKCSNNKETEKAKKIEENEPEPKNQKISDKKPKKNHERG